uniref:DUF4218 domain-containing protein n=1 Tax=Chenopodium quinoa TaxID=63459 RepID=A0A803N9A3_CHEQI
MQCHLLVYGIDNSYNPWVSHGENDKQDDNNENDENTIEVSDDEEDEMPFDEMAPLVFDATNARNNNTTTSEVPIDSGNTMEFGSSSCNDETPNKEFMTLLDDIESELYSGCKTFKRLEFLVTLLHIKVPDLKQMESNIALTLWKLERIFVPAFFDVMIHLPMHLATKARMASPVHYQWMYCFERKMSIIPTSLEQNQQENEIQQPPPRLTYREQRRIDQAELGKKYPDRKRRGLTRGLKYASKRTKNLDEKIIITFMDELRPVVGEKANEFICDCSNWVEEFCPLDALNWAKMDSSAKQSLYDKILAISKVNTANKLKLTETPANGAKSTARIFFDLLNEPPNVSTQDEEPSEHAEVQQQQDPIYVRLYEKTKKHNKKDGTTTWEPNAEKNYEELKRLHETEIAEDGEDTLSVKDAYMKVLKPKSGYGRGLGLGARPPAKLEPKEMIWKGFNLLLKFTHLVHQIKSLEHRMNN